MVTHLIKAMITKKPGQTSCARCIDLDCPMKSSPELGKPDPAYYCYVDCSKLAINTCWLRLNSMQFAEPLIQSGFNRSIIYLRSLPILRRMDNPE